MDILSSIVLARFGNYGPHIVAAFAMAGFVLFMAYRLKVPYWQSAVFVVFAWEFHELLSQVPLQVAHDNFWTYALSNEWQEAVILAALGLFIFRKRIAFHPIPWAVFLAFIGVYMALGWPVTWPPYPQTLWVGLMENAYHVYFLIPFWSMFF